MSHSAELGKKSALSLLGGVLGQVFSALNLVFAGRFLGSATYGDVLYLTAVLSFFSIFAKFGMENALIAFLARGDVALARKRSIVSFALLFALFLAGLFCFFGYAHNEFVLQYVLKDARYASLLSWMLPFLLLDTLRALLPEALRGLRRVGEATFAGTVLPPLVKLLGMALLVFCFDVRDYFALILPTYTATLLSMLYSLRILWQEELLGAVARGFGAREVLLFSLPGLLTSVVGVVASTVDRYMIGYMLGPSQTAVYAAAVQLGAVSSLTLTAVNSIFASLIAQLYYGRALAELRRIYVQATKWITAANFLVLGIVLLFASELMGIAGPEFVAGKTALVWVCLGQMVNSAVGSVGYTNTMTGHPSYGMYVSFFTTGLNVALNAVLIPLWGIEGAAIATMLSLALWNLLSFALLYRNLRMHPYDWRYAGIAAAFLAAFGLTYGLSGVLAALGNWGKLTLGALFYGGVYGAVFWRWGLKREERAALAGVLARLRRGGRA